MFVYLATAVNVRPSCSKLHDLRVRNLPNICSSRRWERGGEGGQRGVKHNSGTEMVALAVYSTFATTSHKQTHENKHFADALGKDR